jgi:glycosyltransferase involved in cell wall biosynthesis
MNHSKPIKYAIISPVKDEKRYVDHTLRSVVGQTLKPEVWIIVDDGSTDGTSVIVRRYADRHDFIRCIDNPQTGARLTTTLAPAHCRLVKMFLPNFLRTERNQSVNEIYYTHSC